VLKFSKISSIVIFDCGCSSGLTFENFWLTSGRQSSEADDDECTDQNSQMSALWLISMADLVLG